MRLLRNRRVESLSVGAIDVTVEEALVLVVPAIEVVIEADGVVVERECLETISVRAQEGPC